MSQLPQDQQTTQNTVTLKPMSQLMGEEGLATPPLGVNYQFDDNNIVSGVDDKCIIDNKYYESTFDRQSVSKFEFKQYKFFVRKTFDG